MVEPLVHRVLPILLVGLMMFGCAMPPPGKPIILRRPASDHRTVRATTPRRPPVASPSVASPSVPDQAPAPAMTPEQKTDLFREFDQYLAKPAP